MHEIFTVEKLAELVDCEVSTLNDLARRNVLPAIKLGRSWVFPAESVFKTLNTMAMDNLTPTKPQVKQKVPPTIPKFPY